MGEMADFELDLHDDEMEAWLEYEDDCGDMSYEDAMDAGFVDERGNDLDPGPRGPFD